MNLTSPNLVQNINLASTPNPTSTKVKVLPPPPKAFRDPPKTIQESEDLPTNHTSSTETTKKATDLTEKNPMANTEPSSGNSVPMRRKVKESYKMDHSTSSLSR